MKEPYAYIVKNIAANIGNRELILRWKNAELEELIYQELGRKAKFYVTRAVSRINNIDTFSDNILKEQKNKYYLVIGLKWNSYDANRYKSMGYSDTKDVCWLLPKPRTFDFKSSIVGGGQKMNMEM